MVNAREKLEEGYGVNGGCNLRSNKRLETDDLHCGPVGSGYIVTTYGVA